MKKITTLFLKDANDLSKVTDQVDPNNAWALTGDSIPTRKFDGTSCAIIEGQLYKRYDAKRGKVAPLGAIPCQDADPITGHHPHWVKCEAGDPSSKYHLKAFQDLRTKEDGTLELCGPKVQGNPEKLDRHMLIRHGAKSLDIPDLSFEGLKAFLSDPSNDIEGIVFHNRKDGRMCKLRKSDFGIKRK